MIEPCLGCRVSGYDPQHRKGENGGGVNKINFLIVFPFLLLTAACNPLDSMGAVPPLSNNFFSFP